MEKKKIKSKQTNKNLLDPEYMLKRVMEVSVNWIYFYMFGSRASAREKSESNFVESAAYETSRGILKKKKYYKYKLSINVNVYLGRDCNKLFHFWKTDK